jgi:hypothetical protein
MNTYYICLTLFGVIAYMMIIDKNVSDLIMLLPKMIRLNLERFYWLIRFHPFMTTNKVAQWWMMRKYEKIARSFDNEQQK